MDLQKLIRWCAVAWVVLLLCLVALRVSSAQTNSTASKASQAASAKKKHSATRHTRSTRVSSKSGKSSKGKKSKKKRGQQAIDSTRTREIQEALIREHYMQGEPSGTWDATTQAAMQKYQADNGWQSKTTPDSRALIKLGLGPNHDHLLNPESAMTSTPATRNTKPAGPKKDDPAQPQR